VSLNKLIVIRVTLVNPILVIQQKVAKKLIFVSKEQINVPLLVVVPMDVPLPLPLVPLPTNALQVHVILQLESVLILRSPVTIQILVQLIAVILTKVVCINQWTVRFLTNVQQVFVKLDNVLMILSHVMIMSIVLRILVTHFQAASLLLIIPIVPLLILV
jgi:hypothetical protein